jgi:hypothetical protein
MELKPVGPSPQISAAMPSLGLVKSPAVAIVQSPTSAPLLPKDTLAQAQATPGQAANTLAFVEENEPPTREDLNWFSTLESKMDLGYQPSVDESIRYNEIARKLDASAAESESAGPPTRTEINWAVDLEKRVKANHKASPEERTEYQKIAIRLLRADQEVSIPQLKTVSHEELAWAKRLETRVTQEKHRATPLEMETYQDIYARFQAEKTETPKPPFPTAEELDWAKDFSNQIRTNHYQPTETEKNRYMDIYVREQASLAPDSDAPSREDLNWQLSFNQKINQGYQPTEAEWDRSSQIMERIYLQETSLLQPESGSLEQHEIDWANRLIYSAEKGIPPTPEETERYEDIFKRYSKDR